jgi:nitrogen fixation negative regulator NifL
MTRKDKPASPAAADPSGVGILPHVFQHAVEQADLAVSITDTQANILYVNPAFTRVTGYSQAEAGGKNESMLSHKTTPPAVYRELWGRITGGQPWSGRLVNRRKDGSRYLAELTITPVHDAEGRVTNYLGLHRDVTELHRLESEVRNQKALIESVVDSAPLALALLDGEDSVVLDNHEYKKLMADLGMAEPATVILDAVRADLGHGMGVPREGGHAFLDREIRIDQPGWRTPRWFSCSGIWVRRDDGDADSFFGRENSILLLLVASEITARRAQQEKARMAALQAMLAEQNRVNELRETLSAAVFQLEGPINVMNSVMGTIERRGCCVPAGDALVEALKAAREAVETLRGAIPSQSPETPLAVNLNEALRDVLDLVTGRLLAAGIGISWRPQAVLPAISGYPNRLRAMLSALVENAIEAMNAKGWRERELTLATRSLGDAIEVLIQDSGPGIPPELRLRVFEPFFTTKKGWGQHPGTGLAIAQQVALDHGGSIEIDPAEAGGCRVRVLLPLGGVVGEPS